MGWYGKLIGAVLGAIIGRGLFGASVGFLIGHLFDRKSADAQRSGGIPSRDFQLLFFRTTFQVMGHVAKADGRVTERDIDGPTAAAAAIQFRSRRNRMKMTVISYSLTGNNERLARSLAGALDAEHLSITESKRRNMGTIAFDNMLNRTPKVSIPTLKPEETDLVVFTGPVWMGQVASPFRACFKEFGPRLGKYAFVSICGGADGPNPKLAAELTKRLGKEPAAVVEMHKADFLPREPKPTRNDTMNYQISNEQLRQLTAKAVAGLKKVTG